MRLQMGARDRLEENSLSNGTLLWWSAVLLDGCFPLSAIALGFSPLSKGEKM
jgi:hypothetical protein